MLDLSSRARERGEGRIREEAEGAREWWVMAVIAFIYTNPPTQHTCIHTSSWCVGEV